jgi:hypothetical protein
MRADAERADAEPLGADRAASGAGGRRADGAASAAARDDGDVLRSTKRRSPAPSRIVIASGSTATSLAPGVISCPCATSFAPPGRRNSA